MTVGSGKPTHRIPMVLGGVSSKSISSMDPLSPPSLEQAQHFPSNYGVSSTTLYPIKKVPGHRLQISPLTNPLPDFTPDITMWIPVWELVVPGPVTHPGLLLLPGQEELTLLPDDGTSESAQIMHSTLEGDMWPITAAETHTDKTQ